MVVLTSLISLCISNALELRQIGLEALDHLVELLVFLEPLTPRPVQNAERRLGHLAELVIVHHRLPRLVIHPRPAFQAGVYCLGNEEGGRHTPFFNGYRPQFYIRTTDVTGSIKLPEGVEMVMPGDNIKMIVDLITPVALEEGVHFAIREGGRTVGAGVLTKILK